MLAASLWSLCFASALATPLPLANAPRADSVGRLGVTSLVQRPPPSHPVEPLLARPSGNSRRLATADVAQQVHVAPGAPGEAFVTFVTTSGGPESVVLYGLSGQGLTERAPGTESVYSVQLCPNNPGDLRNPALGEKTLTNEDLTAIVNTSAYSYMTKTSEAYMVVDAASNVWAYLDRDCVNYKNPLAYFSSPFIHTAHLTNLRAETFYTYRPEVGADVPGAATFSFRLPPLAGARGTAAGKPLRLGVWADVGTTEVSKATMEQLLGKQPDLVLLVGDYSYADGWNVVWDTFGVMMEPLLSSVPMLGCTGNHEISSGAEQGKVWEQRYPQPYRHSGSPTPWWYSYDTGLVHVLSLAGSYAPTDAGRPQYDFTVRDLGRVNRTQTPWIVVIFHTPWYNSNSKHVEEAVKHQYDMEDLFYKHGVDLVFNGHVHSYERSHPVYKGEVDQCGVTHIVVGDGGNYEGPALPWLEPQPTWSAFREGSFGSGMLTIHDENRAEWRWERSACVERATKDGTISGREMPFTWSGKGPVGGPPCSTSGDNSAQASEVADSVILERDTKACPGRKAGSGPGLPLHAAQDDTGGKPAPPAPPAPRPPPPSPVSDKDFLLKSTLAVLLAASVLMNCFLFSRVLWPSNTRRGDQAEDGVELRERTTA